MGFPVPVLVVGYNIGRDAEASRPTDYSQVDDDRRAVVIR
jgi:hypothetical protein